MSMRNDKTRKQAARERLRAERERQARKDRIRRQLIAGGALLAALAAAGGLALAFRGQGDDGWTQDAKKNKLVKPANTAGPQGTTITIGKADAKNTLTLYEDPRCPGCAQFEQNVGERVQQDIRKGSYRASFHLGTFLDGRLGGSGSKNAVSALGAALDVSPDAFLHYKEALYSKRYHPEETGPDDFADDDYLIRVADSVPALKGNAAFRKAVRAGTYDRWAVEVSEAFNPSGGPIVTPTVKLNDTVLGEDGPQGKVAPRTPEDFSAMVEEAAES
ncbi:disulfide bond formation protein DsbA [Streptomyces albus subsp. albus]|nr:disulfide bond formation protein DsbA [Streptomyces albus subsp. albus]